MGNNPVVTNQQYLSGGADSIMEPMVSRSRQGMVGLIKGLVKDPFDLW